MVATTLMTRGRANPTCWRFFDRLRSARLKAGLTREALSKTAGVSLGLASRFELRQGFPRLPTLEALAQALSVSPGWLAFGSEAAWEPSPEGSCDSLAQRFREVRSALGISLREIERRTKLLEHEGRAGLTEGTVRGVERGRKPSLDTLETLAAALGVSPAWLAFGQGPRQLPRRGSRPGEPAPVASSSTL